MESKILKSIGIGPARVVVSKEISSRVSHRDENWDDYDGETIGR